MSHWFVPLLLLLLPGHPGDLFLPAHQDPDATHFFKSRTGWIAGDGALSIPLSNQQVLWLFGDSHIDDYE